MKKLIFAGLIFCGLSNSAWAVHLDGKYPVCMTEDAFERLRAIYKHQDEEAYQIIMKTECFHPKPGLPVEEIVSEGKDSTVFHIKIYLKGRLYDLWTYTANVIAN